MATSQKKTFRELKQSMEAECNGIEQAQTHLENNKISMQELMKETW